MKYILYFLFITLSINVFGQRITIDHIESRIITNQGVEFVGNLKDKNSNDVYSFNSWNNESILYVDSNAYQLSNINFNVITNMFESRIDSKKYFIYRNALIDSVGIKGHVFKKVNNAFYEVLLEKNEKKLFKKHDVEYKEGITNRLDGKVGKSRIYPTFKYLVKYQGEFKAIELKKSSVKGFFKDDEKLENYVKDEKLSYKKEKDIIKILDYMFDEETNATR